MSTPYYNKDTARKARNQAAGAWYDNPAVIQAAAEAKAAEKAAAAGQPAGQTTLQPSIPGTTRAHTPTASELATGLQTVQQKVQKGINTANNLAMLDDLVTKPLSPEEVDRRKRAATNVEGVAQLGNLLSAFANLAGTSNGAMPEVIPGYQGPDIQGWEEMARQKMLQYANMRNAISAQEWEQNYKEQQLALQGQQQQLAQDRWQQEFNEGVRQFNEKQEQAGKELESLNKYREGQVKANQTRADNSGTGRGTTPNEDTFFSGDFEYSFDRRTGNDFTISQMYNAIPEEYRKSLSGGKAPSYYADAPATITKKQKEAIVAYAEQHPEWIDEQAAKYPSVLSKKKIQNAGETFDLNGGDNDTFDLNK